MKLYELPRNTRFKLVDGVDVNCTNIDDEYFFSHVDGMYSYCLDENKNVVHFRAWTEVKIISKE